MEPERLSPLGTPQLRWADLNETEHTRWDYLTAAPSDNDLVKMWWGLGSASLLATIIVGSVLLAVLFSPHARKSPFNLMMVWIMVADLVFSAFCVIVCLSSAAVGHFYSPFMCWFQSWFLFFGAGANAWMNVVIAKELHFMLRCSFRRQRYFPPKPAQVHWRAMLAFAWSLCCSVLVFIPENKYFPHRIGVQTGYACTPLEYDLASSLFFNLVFIPLLVGIPMLYVAYVTYDIYIGRKLLPKSGKARLLARFFTRIVLCFFLWWLPAIFFIFLLPRLPPYPKWLFSLWSHFQGIASAALSLSKPDILGAVKDFWTCRCCCHGMLSNNDSSEAKFGMNSASSTPSIGGAPVTSSTDWDETNATNYIPKEAFSLEADLPADVVNNEELGVILDETGP